MALTGGIARPDLVSQAAFVSVVFAAAYMLGILINRLGDLVMARQDAALRQSFFGGSLAESLVRWRHAQVLVLASSPAVAARLDRGRSLLRIARSAAIILPVTACLLPLALWRSGLPVRCWGLAPTGAVVCALLAWLSHHAWRRLAIADYDIVQTYTKYNFASIGSPGLGQPQLKAGLDIVVRSVQAIVFRLTDSGVSFLLLKRTAARGGFWQSVTGGFLPGEHASDAALRETREETRCEPIAVWPLTHTHCFVKEARMPTGAIERSQNLEQSVGVQLKADAEVVLDPAEHDEFRWAAPDDACASVCWASNAAGIQELARALDAAGIGTTGAGQGRPPEPHACGPAAGCSI